MTAWERTNEDDGEKEKKTRAHNLSQKEALQILNWILNAFVRRIWATNIKKNVALRQNNETHEEIEAAKTRRNGT